MKEEDLQLLLHHQDASLNLFKPPFPCVCDGDKFSIYVLVICSLIHSLAGGTHAREHTWKPKDNFQETALSFHLCVSEIELKSSDLAANAFTNGIILPELIPIFQSYSEN